MRRGKRITKPERIASVSPSPTLKVTEWEALVVKTATHFTTFSSNAPARGPRGVFKTLSEAIADRANNPRVLVYAVTKEGRSVALGPQQYVEMLAARGEK